MATTIPKKIMLQGPYEIKDSFKCAVSVTPGLALAIKAGGTAENELQITAQGGTGAVNFVPFIVLADTLQGKTTADAYTAGDAIRTAIPQRGAKLWVQLDPGDAITKGACVKQVGNAKFAKSTADANNMAVVLEACAEDDTWAKVMWI